MRKSLYLLGSLAVAILVGCQSGDNIASPESREIAVSQTAPLAKSGLPRPMIWADGELFNSIVTPATFNPESDPFDELYVGSFKDGIELISESKPGDSDYNGGRWHKNVLKGGVDPNKYATACSVEDLDLSDFVSTEEYFSCPLQPNRGGN